MTRPARIPSDVNRPERVVGPFTARQAAILAGTGATLYLLWIVLGSLLTPPLFLAGAVPLAASAVVIALGQRDGLSMDKLLIAAVRHRLNPRARPWDLADPSASAGAGSTGEVPGWIRAHTTVDDPSTGRRRRPSGFPARAVTGVQGGRGPVGVGVVDLGPDGLVVIAVASTVNFALRTPAEQDGLVAGFARYLHALGGPVQILIRALPVDLHTHLHQLHTQARHLPHPALAAAAHSHLTHLALLAEQEGDNALLTRQVLLVLREPGRPGSRTTAPERRQPGHHLGRRPSGMGAGEQRLLRRLHDAATLLAAIDVSVTVLDAAHTTAVLIATCNPHRLDMKSGLDSSAILGSTRDGVENDDPPDPDPDPDPDRDRDQFTDEVDDYDVDDYDVDDYDVVGPGRHHDAYGESRDGTRNLGDLDDDLDDDVADGFDARAVNGGLPVVDNGGRDGAVLGDAGWGAVAWTRPSPPRAGGSGPPRRWTR